MSGNLCASDQARVYTEGFCELEPLHVTCQIRIRVIEVQGSTAFEPGIRANTFVHPSPSFERFDNEGDLTRISTLLTAPTPVTGGLLPTDFPFLAERDRYASFGQGKGCADTDDAATDDDNVGRRRRK